MKYEEILISIREWNDRPEKDGNRQFEESCYSTDEFVQFRNSGNAPVVCREGAYTSPRSYEWMSAVNGNSPAREISQPT